MFNAYAFNALRFNPSAVTTQTFRDSISVIKVTNGVDATGVLARNNSALGIGGRVLVGPTTKLIGALSAGATSIIVEAAVFANGDVIVLQTAPTGTQQTEFMSITSGATGTGPFTYSVTRNLDGSGADAWAYGDVIVGLGQSGQSFIDLYTARGLKASSEVGPTIAANVRNSGTYNDWTTRWAIGNLNGLYGYTIDTFGAAFGIPSGTWLKIDATNGVRIGFNATTKVQIDGSGNASFSGSITAAAGSIGGWTIGATSLTASGGSTIAAGNVVIDGNGISIPQGSLSRANGFVLTASGTEFGGLYGQGGSIFVGNPGACYFGFDAGGVAALLGAGASLFVVGGITTDLFSAAGAGYVNSANGFKVGGTKVLGARGAAVAHATNVTDVITQLNALIDRFSASTGGHGSIA